MSEQPFLSVIIPSYNENKNLKRGVLNQVADYLKKQKYSGEVVLSDDGSTDGTQELLKKFAEDNKGFRLLSNVHAGKGPTVKAGMLAIPPQLPNGSCPPPLTPPLRSCTTVMDGNCLRLASTADICSLADAEDIPWRSRIPGRWPPCTSICCRNEGTCNY